MDPSFAMVFPGQGAQSIGMMNALAARFPQVAQRYEEASSALNFDLWRLVSEGPSETLNQTQFTQPALLAASVATWDAWLAEGGAVPCVLAGHSFGEYSALVCAGALPFTAAIELVAARGRFMQEAVPSGAGAMAAVLGLDANALNEVCAQAAGAEVVACANLNAPGQIVISGNVGAVARAGELAKAAGAKRVIPLAVSVPAHCRLMEPAAERYAQMVERVEVSAPRIPVIHNVDVMPHTASHDIKRALIAQLSKPVRWQETMLKFAELGIKKIGECGPGKVLVPLIRRCSSELATFSLNTPDELAAALTDFKAGG